MVAAVTLIATVLLFTPSMLAVTVVVPMLIPVSRPAVSMVPTEGSLLCQETNIEISREAPSE